MAAHIQQWEYFVEVKPAPEGLHPGQLRNLGVKGWELVSEIVCPDPKSHTGYSIRSTFKQPRG